MDNVVLLLILLPSIAASSLTISNMLKQDTSFYYRRIETFPSQQATLEYTAFFNVTRINAHCGIGNCTVILDIYTTDDDKNLQRNCSEDDYGQLRNENL